MTVERVDGSPDFAKRGSTRLILTNGSVSFIDLQHPFTRLSLPDGTFTAFNEWPDIFVADDAPFDVQVLRANVPVDDRPRTDTNRRYFEQAADEGRRALDAHGLRIGVLGVVDERQAFRRHDSGQAVIVDRLVRRSRSQLRIHPNALALAMAPLQVDAVFVLRGVGRVSPLHRLFSEGKWLR